MLQPAFVFILATAPHTSITHSHILFLSSQRGAILVWQLPYEWEKASESWKQIVETKWNECQKELGEPFWPDKAGRAREGSNHHLLSASCDLNTVAILKSKKKKKKYAQNLTGVIWKKNVGYVPKSVISVL